MKQPKSKVLIFGLLMIAACSEWGIAGNSDTSGIGWVSLGMGAGDGVVFKVQASTVNKIMQWSLRYSRVSEFQMLGQQHPAEYVSDLGILGGFLARGQNGRASLSAGVAFVAGVRRGTYIRGDGELFGDSYYDEIQYERIGLAIAAEAVWTPSKSFGLGIEMFGNANTKRSFGGAVLSVHFGKMH